MDGDSVVYVPEEKALKYSTLSIMELSSADERAKKEAQIESLAKDFAANKISAAGVSYIVSDRTRLRRALWFISVMACIIIMGYMTVRVIMEYLQYPKHDISIPHEEKGCHGLGRLDFYLLARGRYFIVFLPPNPPPRDPVEDVILHRLTFPAVTICSLNPISGHNVDETSLKKFLLLKDMMEEVEAEQFNVSVRDACYENPLCEWSWFQEKCKCVTNPCLTEFCLTQNSSHCSCSPFFCNSPSRKVEGCKMALEDQQICQCRERPAEDSWVSNLTQGNIKELLATIPNKDIRQLIQLIKQSKTYDLVDIEEALMPSTKELYEHGVTFDSLVAACSFEGMHCHRENFTVLYDPTFGKCYMFNYVGSLQLLLRVTDHRALHLLRREIGARIVVHDPQILPFVSEYGVNVRPRDMTAVELSLSTRQRLGSPWGSCEKETRRLFNGDPYTLLGCEKYCGYKHMTTQCNCTKRHFMRGTILSKFSSSFHLCNFTDEAQRECAYRVSQNIERLEECGCRPPCKEAIYSYTVTASELNENYYRTVKAIRTLSLDSAGKKKYMNYSDVKSMVGVKVYYNTFQVSKHNEVASYSWETLMANIGGNLGFFMGLTLVTFLEITEFIWDIFNIACGRVTPDNKVRKLQNKKSQDINHLFSTKFENSGKRRRLSL
ncbi:degenerin-like protein unc-105 [Caerostris darwini]|uniref:Degenerin-like protein unc-105 n=1 Tax=Caerostris darwini TaxID=1538125 RepID=A0AAV4P815_9ARAC|nr:degenerin-like protein unc-105 [Caerostris darwini]